MKAHTAFTLTLDLRLKAHTAFARTQANTQTPTCTKRTCSSDVETQCFIINYAHTISWRWNTIPFSRYAWDAWPQRRLSCAKDRSYTIVKVCFLSARYVLSPHENCFQLKQAAFDSHVLPHTQHALTQLGDSEEILSDFNEACSLSSFVAVLLQYLQNANSISLLLP